MINADLYCASACEAMINRHSSMQADTFGRPYIAEAVHQWLLSILHDDLMVDAFAELYPQACDRFTCWDQHTNQVQPYSCVRSVGYEIDHLIK